VPDNYREGLVHGWAKIFERVRKQTEGK